MFKNYLKTGWRNLKKHKVHSFINIAGLAVGMAVSMLIGLWMWDEVSFDHVFKNHDRIAQVKQHLTNNGETQTWEQVPYPLAAELRKSYGNDFKYIVMMAGMGDHILAIDNKKVTIKGAFMETQGPDMLTLEILKGSKNGLKDPSSILISAATAKACFGDADPISKTLKIDNTINAKIAGVYKDLPQNSTFANMGFTGSWEMYYNNNEWVRTMGDPWRPNAFSLYVQLADNADLAILSLKIRDVKLRKLNAQLAKKKPALFLQSMNDWHLYNEFKDGKNTGGRIQYVWMFGIIDVFVLLLACINFMNLSTARSEKRAREVGIRKAVGSLRSQLIYQFFSESLICVAVSFALALLLVVLSMPYFNEVANKQMVILWDSPVFWLLSIGFSLITGLVAGSYPAFYLSSFEPVKVLKGSFRVGRFAAIPRKVLVVVQFTVSIVLIIGTIVVFGQIQYAKNRPLGYERDGLVAITLRTAQINSHYDAVKNELIKTGAISGIGMGDVAPLEYSGSTSGIEWKGKDPNLSVDFTKAGVSVGYAKTAGWQFKQGRDFLPEFKTDSSAVILNEAAVKFMGLKNPIGETIHWFGQPMTIVGVIKDIVADSPYGEVKPGVYFFNRGSAGNLLVKINPKVSMSSALEIIAPIFKKFDPEQPFEYRIVDDLYAQKFGNEQRIGKLAAFFASLAILISCLGLFGMASFMAEQRVKEIGVRKVLGASVFNLWRLLSGDFLGLVVISLLIASPVAWYLMHNWLQHFDYRSSISIWVFIITGAGALIITLVTVSFQTINASLANPVKSLKSE
jgi:putative ABC transport system permease protein